MSKRMLINATQPEELRVALVDGQWLFDLDIEIPGREQKKGNIYKGRVIRYEPSLEALFVYYGSDRHGFLPIREISPAYLINTGIEEINRYNIKDILPDGKEILVQIDKEERGTKGAALTTFISIAGCYLVLMPNNPRAGGISRRIEGEERAELREILNALSIPDGMGVIIRTAGVGRRIEELKWDLSVLLSQWSAILEAANTCNAPALIHQEGNAVIRAVRDYLRPDIEEMLIDERNVYDNVRAYIQMVKPDFLSRVKLYEDAIPLFNRYQIESQIETAFKRSVQLPSGGALVIDHTEALVSIDINSARATRGGDIEETALHTNLEAADEIARQLRLRDIGGLIVIDFIDMMSVRNQRQVENRLRQAVEMDRARIQIGRISRFGLLEMSRQRLRPVLGESSRIPCPRCEGQGNIRSVDSQALIVLRVMEEEAIKDNTGEVLAELPLDVATYLMNEKRQGLLNIEKRHSIKIIIVPNSHLVNPQYFVSRVRVDEMASRQIETASYQLTTKTETKITETIVATRTPQIEEPAVKKTYIPPTPAPQQKEGSGLIKKIFGLFGREAEKSSEITTDTGINTSPTAQQRVAGQGGYRGRQSQPSGQQRTGSQRENYQRRARPSNRPSDRRPSKGPAAPTFGQTESTQATESARKEHPERSGQERQERQDRRGQGGKRSGWRGRSRPHHKRKSPQDRSQGSQERSDERRSEFNPHQNFPSDHSDHASHAPDHSVGHNHHSEQPHHDRQHNRQYEHPSNQEDRQSQSHGHHKDHQSRHHNHRDRRQDEPRSHQANYSEYDSFKYQQEKTTEQTVIFLPDESEKEKG